MKKYLFFILFINFYTGVHAQSLEIDRIKNELKTHAEQDTFRVNRLNLLAFNLSLPAEEREKFAAEAIAISDKINYDTGKGKALIS